MSEIYLGLGSNVEKARNIAFGLAQLRECFGEMQCSPTYESEAVGCDGSNFYNLVVCVQSDLSIASLTGITRGIETASGRDRRQAKYSPRCLDIDILLIDDWVGDFDGVRLPREDILLNAFVLLPLSELAPNKHHPIVDKSYADLWQAFDRQEQKLWRLG